MTDTEKLTLIADWFKAVLPILRQMYDRTEGLVQALNATPPPPPPPPPPPVDLPRIVSLMLTPTLINAGEPVGVRWELAGPAPTKLWLRTTEWPGMEVGAQGFLDIFPSVTTTVTLEVFAGAAIADTKYANVQVAGSPDPDPNLPPPSGLPADLAGAMAAVARFSVAPAAVAVVSGRFREAGNWFAQSGESGVHSIGEGIEMEIDDTGGETPE